MREQQSVSDQAETLRRLRQTMSDAPGSVAPESASGAYKSGKVPRVFSVTSGKGGVGKTAVVTNVALSLARAGKRVLILDADLGLANIDVSFGLTPRYTLADFFSSSRELSEILIDGPSGLRILPAGSGEQSLTSLDSPQRMRFVQALQELDEEFDIILIDTEAGISRNVTYFNSAAQDIVIVTTGDPTAITDAYALMKLLSAEYGEKNFYLVVNHVASRDEGLEVYQKLTMISNRFLDIAVDYLGCIPEDRKMVECLRRQRAIVEEYPEEETSRIFGELAEDLLLTPERLGAKGTLQFFWAKNLDIGAEEAI
ncbi:MAG TPA: MinD/ParA family protein [Desulfomicrobiaceae bacterium]|nr:MinD/ParA family protein [Desulfomicrobiaceae bacterium]